ncbi:MAG: hypothetical protein ACI4MQ_01120 [Candidatus Coproplasma sp.]
MKKTNKIIMGITALAVAFSACAFTACSSEPTDGSIKGNYKEATAEEVNSALSTVNQETLFGDTTAENYKFGIELSSSFNASVTGATGTSSIKLSTGYEMLATKGESNLTYKGEGSFTMNAENTPAEGEKTTNELALNLWQDDAMTYAKLTMTSSEDKEGEEPQPTKIKFDVSELVSSLIPSGDSSTTVPSLPEGIELPEGTTTPDLSSLDLVSAVNALNEMGATVSMDTTNGIKLKISITEEVVNNLIVTMMGATADQVSDLVSFSKCSLDFYLAINKNGMLSATSIVADVDAAINIPTSQTTVSTTTLKLNGYLYFAVNANVTPEVPESLKTDLTYFDMTNMLPAYIGSIIGGGMLG